MPGLFCTGGRSGVQSRAAVGGGHFKIDQVYGGGASSQLARKVAQDPRHGMRRSRSNCNVCETLKMKDQQGVIEASPLSILCRRRWREAPELKEREGRKNRSRGGACWKLTPTQKEEAGGEGNGVSRKTTLQLTPNQWGGREKVGKRGPALERAGVRRFLVLSHKGGEGK